MVLLAILPLISTTTVRSEKLVTEGPWQEPAQVPLASLVESFNSELGPRRVIHPPSVGALQRRLSKLREQVPAHVRALIVVKNVHDAASWARALDAADHEDVIYGYGFECIADAMSYRKEAPTSQKVVLLLYSSDPHQAPALARARIEPSVTSSWWVHSAVGALQRDGVQGWPLRVHLWVDTGMGRDGLLPAAAEAVAAGIHRAEGMEMAGVMSHLCCTMYTTSPSRHGDSSMVRLRREVGAAAMRGWDKAEKTRQQVQRFEDFTRGLRAKGLLPAGALRHLASSGAVAHGLEETFFDMVRVGRFVVDGDEDSATATARREIREALEQGPNPPPPNCPARVVGVKTLPAGWCVGYGCERMRYVQQEKGPLAVETKVAMLAEECPGGGSGPMYDGDSAHAFDAEGKEFPIMLSHGSCGTVVRVPHGMQLTEGDMVEIQEEGLR